ncbi:MAG: tRNA (adenosine(37)-N6)-threonylcarbamoyltransferase complex dimerization subunit type 1 TsaB [Phototrophicaceae bacterium]
MLIAIDTATQYLGLALYHEDALIAEQTWRTGNKHNLILASTIQHMLHICDVNPDDLSMIAVAKGPGSYTGLRIGVALAKGLASVNQLPLIGINTLDIIAAGQPFANTKHRLLCILPAGRGRVIVGEYQVKKGRWIALNEPEITNWDDLLTGLDAPSYYFAGELDSDGLAAIAAFKHADVNLTVIDAAQRLRRPGILAREAWTLYHTGKASDFIPAKLAPVYMNTPG